MQRHASLTKMVENPKGFDAYKFGLLMEEAIAGPQGPVFKTKKTFSPSSIGYGHGTCPRYWHIVFTGAEFHDSPDSISGGNMQNGTYVHERLQQTLTKALGKNVEIEREINLTDPPIRGFVDAIVDQDGVKAAGEIKSAKQEIFDKIAQTGKPITYHLVQLLIYMKSLGLKDGFFYYENKNTQEFVIIPVQMNDSLEQYAEEIFQWMRDVRAAWDEGKLATPISPKRAAKACTYCPVKQACKDRADGDITIPLLAVKE